MRTIKSFLRKIDLFGVYYNFRYKSREKYQTPFGGLFILIFIILVCFIGIYYFIPFINRKNYTIVYYTMNLAATEQVSLFSSESNFAVGLDCESNKNEKYIITDLLDLKGRYVSYFKNRDGTYKKDANQLNLHKCTYDDFYNKYDKQMDYLGALKFECVENTNKENTIQGIFSDQVFSYFEFSVTAKNNSKELTDEIIRFLFENDCKLQFVYTDIIIDLDNYENPATQYLNIIFSQLNPTLFIKRNIYFMNQYFSNDDYLLFVFGDEDPSEVKPLYSRYEEYVLYKGMNRFTEHPDEYEYYTKIYIRADLKKTVIKRKYQKFMEFYADASSLLIAIYAILDFIFNYINTFYANHSLSKSIFFFKDLEEENSFNLFKKRQKIQELISITDIYQTKNNNNSNNEYDKDNNYSSPKNKISVRFNNLESNKDNYKKEIIRRNINYHNLGIAKDSTSSQFLDYGRNRNVTIYNKKKNKSPNKNIRNNYYNNNSIESKKEIERLRTNKIIYSKNLINSNIYNNSYKYTLKEKEDDNYSKYNKNQNINDKQGEAMVYFKKREKEDDFSDSQGTNMDDYSSESSNENKKKATRIYNSFNIFEIVITEFFKCCRSKEMTVKSDVNEKANNIIFKKMDIITYVRTMILFDLLNQIILNDSKKTIINFLCRPVISLDNDIKKEFNEFYKNYKERDFKKYYQEIQNLSQKQNKDDKDIKYLSVSNEHLQAFI